VDTATWRIIIIQRSQMPSRLGGRLARRTGGLLLVSSTIALPRRPPKAGDVCAGFGPPVCRAMVASRRYAAEHCLQIGYRPSGRRSVFQYCPTGFTTPHRLQSFLSPVVNSTRLLPSAELRLGKFVLKAPARCRGFLSCRTAARAPRQSQSLLTAVQLRRVRSFLCTTHSAQHR
jgi:hypothetical protein